MALLLSNGCARVKIIDHEFCGDMGIDGATCAHFLTEEERDIPKDRWDEERFGQICVKSDVYSDWKSVIEKLCSSSGKCDYETKKALSTFFLKIESLIAKSKK